MNWIPVTDDLPDSVRDVLTVNKNGLIEIGYHTKTVARWRVPSEVDVTHWMELPPPPMEAIDSKREGCTQDKKETVRVV